MDLRQLTNLVAVADHGTFSAAARGLFTVQSNVSGHVSRLEKELGVTLVDRERGGLTDEGVIVVMRARRIFHELDDLAAEMASRGDDVSGDSRLGVIGTTARWLLPQLLGQVSRAHPHVHVTIHEGNTSSLLPRLQAAQIDAAILHLPIDEPELQVDALFAEDLLLVAHTKYGIAEAGSIALRDLVGIPLLLPPQGTALRRIIDRAADAADVELRAQAEIDGVRLLASLAFEGYGPAIVPATSIPRWLKGDFRRVAVPELPRRVVGWVQRRRPPPGIPTLALLNVLREVIAIQGPKQPGLHVGVEAFPLGRAV
jgi:DNA-binding transcriptional LysR family regulator